MRKDREIKAVVEAAFCPLRCVAEIYDYDKKLRFRVFDAKDRAVVTFPDEGLGKRKLRIDTFLETVISSARDRVEEKGFALEQWTLPRSS